MTRWALALIVLSGCAAPREAFRDLPDPRTLADVNALLAGATVAVHLADGTTIERARGVRVSADSVRLAVRRGTVSRAVPTRDVLRITRVRGRGTRYGAAFGAVPGLLIVYSGVRESGSRRQGERDASEAGLSLSIPAILVGAAFGAWIGQLTTPGETVTLYRAPLGRYLPPGGG